MISIEIYSQAVPTYTAHYRFRKYAQGALHVTADSLNQNWTDADNDLYNFFIALGDTAAALRTSLAGVTTSSFVDLTSSQSVSGNKTFSGTNSYTGSTTVSNLIYNIVTYNPITDITTFALSTSTNFIVIAPPGGGISALSSITGASAGTVLTMLMNPSSGGHITLKNGTGNLFLMGPADWTMYAGDVIQMICYSSTWYEISRTAHTYIAPAPPLQH